MEESRKMETVEDSVDGAYADDLQVAKHLREVAASQKITYALMDPVLWGNLPRELLGLVLARLPVPEVTRLRCHLSKEWTMNTEFNRACDEANPNMAALVSYIWRTNEFSVRIFDFRKFLWLYAYRIRLTNWGSAPSGVVADWKAIASDGGLICFVSTWKSTEANPLGIVVINPLTRVQHELPPLQYFSFLPPILVHMKVDFETKSYKVVVVFEVKSLDTVETYDSISRQWSIEVPPWGRIFVRARERSISVIDARRCFRSNRLWPCAYDLRKRQLKFLDCDVLFQSKGALVNQCVLVGDRAFVLHNKWNGHDIGPGFPFITEFQFQSSVGAGVWVPVKTHDHIFPEMGDWSADLRACEDVLVVRNSKHTEIQFCWFLNFATSEWHNIPEESQESEDVSLICRGFWHIMP